MKLTLAVCLYCVGFFLPTFGQRAAFFIGIDNYKYMGRLSNCAHDADSMKAALAALGYDTFEVTNVSNAEVRDSLGRWFKLMSKYRDVVIYFSGHGFMVASNNEYLALNDFNPRSYRDVDTLTIHKNFLMANLGRLDSPLGAFPTNKIVIIDACREFPDKKKIVEALKSIQLEEPAALRHFVFFFTTQAGGVTLGDGPNNSRATTILLKQLHDSARKYEDQELFWNDINDALEINSNLSMEFLDYGTFFPWRFADPPCNLCALPNIPNGHVCDHCEPQHLALLSEYLGADFGKTRLLNLSSNFRPLSVSPANRYYTADFAFSPVGQKLSGFIRGNVPEQLYNPLGSFVVYEFQNERLSAIQVYLKFRDISFHSRLASALGIDLEAFPGFTYMTFSHDQLIEGKPPSEEKGFVALFGRVARYGYSIIELGAADELYNDSYHLDKFKQVFKARDIPKLTPGQ